MNQLISSQLISSAAITFVALFPIANPIGVIPTFYSLTGEETPRRRFRQARQIAVNVIVVLAIFLVAGRLILDLLGLSLGVLQITGGLLVAHTAWAIVTAQPSLLSPGADSGKGKDFTLIPMAFPIISGPGAIGMVVGLIAKDPQPIKYAGSLLGIAGIGALVYICLALGEPLLRLLGRSGVDAFTRILGFFILAIAIQLTIDGTLSVLQEFPLAELSIFPASAH